MTDDTKRKSGRGFASMSKERQKEIASQGGQAVPSHKRSFSSNRALAAAAGRKGGMAVPGEKRSFSIDRILASRAGTKGGEAVPDEKRTFSKDPLLAQAAGRKGGQMNRKQPEEAANAEDKTDSPEPGTPASVDG